MRICRMLESDSTKESPTWLDHLSRWSELILPTPESDILGFLYLGQGFVPVSTTIDFRIRLISKAEGAGCACSHRDGPHPIGHSALGTRQ